jgi:hypothetical protein
MNGQDWLSFRLVFNMTVYLLVSNKEIELTHVALIVCSETSKCIEQVLQSNKYRNTRRVKFPKSRNMYFFRFQFKA